jgi:hypothetical protein
MYSRYSAHDSHGCWFFSYIIEEPRTDGSMQRRRCGVRDHEDERPHHHRHPNDRVDVEVRRRGGSRLSSLLPPLSTAVLILVSVSIHLVVVIRRTLRAALGSTVEHAARSPARKQPTTSSGLSSLRERANNGRTRVDQVSVMVVRNSGKLKLNAR